MNPRFAALVALLAMAILLLLVGAFVSRVWSEGFCGQRGHGGHSGHRGHSGNGGVRYGIAHHDRGGRVHGGHSNIYYGGGSGSWGFYWPYGWPMWVYWPYRLW